MTNSRRHNEELIFGKDYAIAERFYDSGYKGNMKRKVLQIKFDVKYLAKLETAKGIYHCFGRIVHCAHVHHCYLPSEKRFEDHKYPDRVGIDALREGDFRVLGKEVITNPDAKVVLVMFEDHGIPGVSPVDANSEMCRNLISKLGAIK